MIKNIGVPSVFVMTIDKSFKPNKRRSCQTPGWCELSRRWYWQGSGMTQLRFSYYKGMNNAPISKQSILTALSATCARAQQQKYKAVRYKT